MSRILKSTRINIDNNNVVSIDNNILDKIDLINQKLAESHEFDETEDNNDISQIESEIIEAARIQAEKIIENAKIKANNIIKSAENTQNEINNKALKIFEDSEQKGYKEGFDKAILENEGIKASALDLLEKTRLEREETIINLESEIVEIIIGITKKIMTNEFYFNPEIISLLIKKGLNNIKVFENLKICVSENHYEFLEKNKDSLIELDLAKGNIEILKDVRLSNMDCIIETDFGTVKCSVDEQLVGIKEALHYILG